MANLENLTPKEAADKLRIHERTVRRLLAEGILPGTRLGRKTWRISAAALKAHMEGGGTEKQNADTEPELNTLTPDDQKRVQRLSELLQQAGGGQLDDTLRTVIDSQLDFLQAGLERRQK